MSKYPIDLSQKEKTDGKINEIELIDEITKNEFFQWMKTNGYGYNEIKEIFDGKRLSAGEQSHFNITIRKAKKEANISITETIIFLEETFAKFKRILSVFDGETRFELKKELSENYRIELDKSNLSQILG